MQKFLMMLSGLVLALALVGCEKEGPAEKAGEAADKAVEQTGQQLEQAGEKAQEGMGQ
jgi:outer membrane PBP1 activator LpoA protein